MSRPADNIAARITGTFRGIPFEYIDKDSEKSQYIHYGEDGTADPSTFWWAEGNFSCDCNRAFILPNDLRETLPLEGDNVEAEHYKCGNEIRIDRIEPLQEGYPTLILNESSEADL